MPVHDWTRVDAGIFHDFHHEWVGSIKHALNAGVLPEGYYALAEQIAGGLGPDVLTLQAPEPGNGSNPNTSAGEGGVTVAANPPKVWHHTRVEIDLYAKKAAGVVIRHRTGHRVVAMIEIVSPGNKASQQPFQKFIDKAEEVLRQGIHLMVIDVFPPGPRDPQGIHKALWDRFEEKEFTLPGDRPLTMASYIGGDIPEAFVEPTAVGLPLPEMPLFLTADRYIPIQLEATYQTAWNEVPSYWRAVLERPGE
jgi:hypothetical protein